MKMKNIKIIFKIIKEILIIPFVLFSIFTMVCSYFLIISFPLLLLSIQNNNSCLFEFIIVTFGVIGWIIAIGQNIKENLYE